MSFAYSFRCPRPGMGWRSASPYGLLEPVSARILGALDPDLCRTSGPSPDGPGETPAPGVRRTDPGEKIPASARIPSLRRGRSFWDGLCPPRQTGHVRCPGRHFEECRPGRGCRGGGGHRCDSPLPGRFSGRHPLKNAHPSLGCRRARLATVVRTSLRDLRPGKVQGRLHPAHPSGGAPRFRAFLPAFRDIPPSGTHPHAAPQNLAKKQFFRKTGETGC
ncbi:hypothetical protein ABH19_11065 [Leptospirillum sp. Group II 'CF-1']|nr:hypothetical protein ABH19_11065 [Leptospirillum sp. Group II 'CF-1']